MLGYLLLPLAPAMAAEETHVDPQFNPVCWTEQDCARTRKDLFQLEESEAKQGFYAKESPCIKEGWGKCLPAGQTTASVSFGGKREFKNIGEYIQVIYSYALRIAAILAVVVIIIAGAQYMTSGGNSEMINSAKKRIMGALVGLFIAYMSYFILSSINPALVSLRLPQVWLVRKVILSTEFCADVPNDIKLASADNLNALSSVEEVKKAFSQVTDFNIALSQINNTDELQCGKRFLVKDSGGAMCLGDFCDDGICYMGGGGSDEEPYSCRGGAKVIGKIIGSRYSGSGCPSSIFGTLVGEGWAYPWIQTEEILTGAINGIGVVCNDGSSDVEGSLWWYDADDTEQAEMFDIGAKEVYYEIRAITNGEIDELADWCERKGGGLKGFAIFFVFNEDCDPVDEVHGVGRGGIDLGDINRNGGGIFSWGQGSSVKAAKLKKEYFFTAEEMKKGVRFNVDIGDIHDIDEGVDQEVYKSLMEK